MWNPDLLDQSKITTVFPKGAGRSRAGTTAVPPRRDWINLIFHLDRYFDWTPAPPSRMSSLRVSGLPSSDLDGRTFSFYKEFVWYPVSLMGVCPCQEYRTCATPARGHLLPIVTRVRMGTTARGLAGTGQITSMLVADRLMICSCEDRASWTGTVRAL
jgi:hypothetical protein